MTTTEYLHYVKVRADEPALRGALMDDEDLTDKILDGLGNDCKELVRAVQARDTSISFDELHEKLLSFEASTSAPINVEAAHLPITTNPTQRTNHTWRQLLLASLLFLSGWWNELAFPKYQQWTSSPASQSRTSISQQPHSSTTILRVLLNLWHSGIHIQEMSFFSGDSSSIIHLGIFTI